MAEATVEAGPDPVEAAGEAVEVEVGGVAPVMLTTLLSTRVTFTGNSGRELGHALTDTTVPGVTTRAPAQDMTEILVQLK